MTWGGGVGGSKGEHGLQIQVKKEWFVKEKWCIGKFRWVDSLIELVSP